MEPLLVAIDIASRGERAMSSPPATRVLGQQVSRVASSTLPGSGGVSSSAPSQHQYARMSVESWSPQQVSVFFQLLDLPRLATLMQAYQMTGRRLLSLDDTEVRHITAVRPEHDVYQLPKILSMLRDHRQQTSATQSRKGQLQQAAPKSKKWRMMLGGCGGSLAFSSVCSDEVKNIQFAPGRPMPPSLDPSVVRFLSNHFHYRLQLFDVNTSEPIPLVGKESKSCGPCISYSRTASFVAKHGQEYFAVLIRSDEMAELFPDERFRLSFSSQAGATAQFEESNNQSYATIVAANVNGSERWFRLKFESSQLRRNKDLDGLEEVIRENADRAPVGQLAFEIIRPSRLTPEQLIRFNARKQFTLHGKKVRSTAASASQSSPQPVVARFERVALQLEQKPFQYGDATTGLGAEWNASTAPEKRKDDSGNRHQSLLSMGWRPDQIKMMHDISPATVQFGANYDTLESLHARKFILAGDPLYDASMDPDVRPPPAFVVKREPGTALCLTPGLKYDVPTRVECDMTGEETTVWTETCIKPRAPVSVEADGDAEMR